MFLEQERKLEMESNVVLLLQAGNERRFDFDQSSQDRNEWSWNVSGPLRLSPAYSLTWNP